MYRSTLLSTAAALLLAQTASAQYAAIWKQCGGITYIGPTVCDPTYVPPLTCVVHNIYVSQCLVVESSSSTTSNTSSTSTRPDVKESTTSYNSTISDPPKSSTTSYNFTSTTWDKSSSTLNSTSSSWSTTVDPPKSSSTIISSTSTRPVTSSSAVTRTSTSKSSSASKSSSTTSSKSSTTSKSTSSTKSTTTSSSKSTSTSSTKTCTSSTSTSTKRPVPTIRWPIFVPIGGVRVTGFELNELPSGAANLNATGIDGTFEVVRGPLGGPITWYPWPWPVIDPCTIIRIRHLTLDEAYPFSYKPLSWTEDAKTNYWVVPEKGLVSTSPYSPFGNVTTFLSCDSGAELYLQTGDELPKDVECESVVLEFDG